MLHMYMLKLNQKELNQLKMGVDYSFVDKNKHVKKNIAASIEHVAGAVDKDLDNEKGKDFHESLRAYTDILSKNLYLSTD